MPLLIDRNGNKLGKSENSDNIWLDSNKTSLLDFYQFFRQLHDDDAEKLFRYLSLKAIQDVESIIETHKNKLGQWVAQQHIADEMTSLVHGVKKLQTVKKCSEVFYQRDFGGSNTINLKYSLGTQQTYVYASDIRPVIRGAK